MVVVHLWSQFDLRKSTSKHCHKSRYWPIVSCIIVIKEKLSRHLSTVHKLTNKLERGGLLKSAGIYHSELIPDVVDYSPKKCFGISPGKSNMPSNSKHSIDVANLIETEKEMYILILMG